MRGADYVIKRGFFAIVTIFVAITINFFLFRVLPGQRGHRPARVPHASAAAAARADHASSAWTSRSGSSTCIYLRQLAHGNMGISFAYQQPVTHLLIADLKNTIPMVTVGTRRHRRRHRHRRAVRLAARLAADHVSTNLGHRALRVPHPVARP